MKKQSRMAGTVSISLYRAIRLFCIHVIQFWYLFSSGLCSVLISVQFWSLWI